MMPYHTLCELVTIRHRELPAEAERERRAAQACPEQTAAPAAARLSRRRPSFALVAVRSLLTSLATVAFGGFAQ